MSSKIRVQANNSSMTISERVEAVFSDSSSPSYQYAKDYLDTLRKNWDQVEDRLRRTILLLFFFIASFEIISQSSILPEISIGPLKLKDVSLIEKFIPSVISMYFFELVSLTALRNQMSIVHNKIMSKLYKHLSDVDLDFYLEPSTSLIDLRHIPRNRQWFKIIRSVFGGLAILIFLSPIFFVIYDFYRIISIFGSDFLILVSIIVSLFFILLSIIRFISFSPQKEPN